MWLFERIARKAYLFDTLPSPIEIEEHPFESRNIHPRLPRIVLKLFNDGHFSQATFEAYKFLDKEVQRLANHTESGVKLMMDVFNEDKPQIRLNKLSSQSEIDEQRGFRFIFAGSMAAIRDPRGHEVNIVEPPDKCLDHLSLVSLLLRRLDEINS